MASALKSGGAVRVGVVGVGVMGSNHARVLTGISDVKLAGVVDPDPAQRELVTAGWAVPPSTSSMRCWTSASMR